MYILIIIYIKIYDNILYSTFHSKMFKGVNNMIVVEEDNFDYGKIEYEKWRQRRRDEWSRHKGDFATRDLQNKFQQITGLSDYIVKSDEDIPLQLWIDDVTDKLESYYHSIDETIPQSANYTTVLNMIGFKEEFLKKHTEDLDSDIGSHYSLVDTIELIIDRVLVDC